MHEYRAVHVDGVPFWTCVKCGQYQPNGRHEDLDREGCRDA